MHYFEGLSFFMTLGLVLIVAFILNVFQKSTYYLSLLFSLVMVYFVFIKTPDQLIALLGFVVLGYILMQLTSKLKERKKTMPIMVLLAGLPLIVVKVLPVFNVNGFGFLGISYLTFRAVGMIIEMRDGVLKEFTLWEFLRFMLFMPTFSSGPIDRFKRFNEDYNAIPEREELLDMLEQAVKYIMYGFLYKFILAHIFGHLLLGHVQTYALSQGGFFNIGTLGVMYVYGFDLFFDFAGYSMFALAASNLMGIKSPINFDRPFKSRDLKEFWNRWHMSLSFWFRDFVFMRLVMVLMRNKVFKSRITTSNVAYIINMLVMGFWHGVTWYYIAYGLFHGLGLVINDAWIRKKKTINKERKAIRYPMIIPANFMTFLCTVNFAFPFLDGSCFISSFVSILRSKIFAYIFLLFLI